MQRIASFNTESSIKRLFAAAIQKAFPAVAQPDMLVVPAKKGGDFQCNNAMALAKALGATGAKLTPKQVADAMVSNLPENDLIQSATASDQGFIIVNVAPAWSAAAIQRIAAAGAIAPPEVQRERVLVDFSSPNIAKEMHVGHLRSTIIGECICRLFEFLGHDVARINHVGDWGTQFGMLILYLKQTYPEFLESPPNITDLTVFYKAAKNKFDADPEFKEQARLEVVKLQSLDPACIKAWQLFCQISRAEFQEIYDRLEVTLTERGESFYNPQIPDVIRELGAKGMLEESEGARLIVSREAKKIADLDAKDATKLVASLVFEKRDGSVEWSPVLVRLATAQGVLSGDTVVFSPKETKKLADLDLQKDLDKFTKALMPLFKPSLHPDLAEAFGRFITGDQIRVPRFNFPLIALKSDGGYTYDTTDLAAMHHRFVQERYSRVVYVTDVGQFEHFRMVAQAAVEAGWIAGAARWQHAGFGLVTGEDGKRLKTRSGETVKLKDLLDEARDRCLATLRERESGDQRQGFSEEQITHLARTIGYGAVKYFDLRQNRASDYGFSFDKVLDMNGNTAVFLLYSYARLCSIQRKANVAVADALAAGPIVFTTPTENQLALHALRLSATIERTTEDLSPKNLTDYAYDLVGAVSDFYRDCRVIGDPNMNSRLVLIEAVRLSLKLALHILGIAVADRL